MKWSDLHKKAVEIWIHTGKICGGMEEEAGGDWTFKFFCRRIVVSLVYSWFWLFLFGHEIVYKVVEGFHGREKTEFSLVDWSLQRANVDDLLSIRLKTEIGFQGRDGTDAFTIGDSQALRFQIPLWTTQPCSITITRRLLQYQEADNKYEFAYSSV